MPTESHWSWHCCKCRWSFSSVEIELKCWSCDHERCAFCRVEKGYVSSRTAQVAERIREATPSVSEPSSRHDEIHRTPIQQNDSPARDLDPFDEFIQWPSEVEQTDTECTLGQNDLSPPRWDPFDDFNPWSEHIYTSGPLHKSQQALRFQRILQSDRRFTRLTLAGFQKNPDTFSEVLEICFRTFGRELQKYATAAEEHDVSAYIASQASAIVWTLKSNIPQLASSIESSKDTKSDHDKSHGALISSSNKSSSQSSIYVGEKEKIPRVSRFVLGSRSYQRLLAEIDWLIVSFQNEGILSALGHAQVKRSKIAKAVANLVEPRQKSGTVRIRWKCSCGAKMWDDFPSRDEIGVRILTARLNRLFTTTLEQSEISQRSSPTETKPGRLQSLGNTFINVWKHFKKFTTSLSPRPYTRNETLPTDRSRQPNQSPYFLTCVDTGQYLRISQALPKLFESSCDDVANDQEYFRMLRRSYEDASSEWRRNLTFRAVNAIEYVRVRKFRALCAEYLLTS